MLQLQPVKTITSTYPFAIRHSGHHDNVHGVVRLPGSFRKIWLEVAAVHGIRQGDHSLWLHTRSQHQVLATGVGDADTTIDIGQSEAENFIDVNAGHVSKAYEDKRTNNESPGQWCSIVPPPCTGTQKLS